MKITLQFPGDGNDTPITQVNKSFMQGMVDRMATSYYKYGSILSKDIPKFRDTVADMKKRIQKYEETGNAEWLMDVSNFAMIEFTNPTRKDTHFRATDSDESPGIKIVGEGFRSDVKSY